jgi:hypothetical protein
MFDSTDRATILERLLTAEIPESRSWTRGASAGGWWTEVPSPAAPGERRLEVELRQDGDVDVRFHYSAKSRGPAEAHYPVVDGHEAEVLRHVARFVADLLAERLVLAFRRGWFRGGREFIPPAELTPEHKRQLECVISWRGTYDWPAPPEPG